VSGRCLTRCRRHGVDRVACGKARLTHCSSGSRLVYVATGNGLGSRAASAAELAEAADWLPQSPRGTLTPRCAPSARIGHRHSSDRSACCRQPAAVRWPSYGIAESHGIVEPTARCRVAVRRSTCWSARVVVHLRNNDVRGRSERVADADLSTYSPATCRSTDPDVAADLWNRGDEEPGTTGPTDTARAPSRPVRRAPGRTPADTAQHASGVHRGALKRQVSQVLSGRPGREGTAAWLDTRARPDRGGRTPQGATRLTTKRRQVGAPRAARPIWLSLCARRRVHVHVGRPRTQSATCRIAGLSDEQ